MNQQLELSNQNKEIEKIEEIQPITLHEGIANVEITEAENKILAEDIPEDEILIRPDGLVYLDQVKYRQILIRAFGVGKWALKRINITLADGQIYYQGALYIKGCYIAEAIGEHPYFENTDSSTYGKAAESAKSDCLTRCCKDLGVAWKLWNIEYVEQWKKKNAYWKMCENKSDNKKGNRKIWAKNGQDIKWPWVPIDKKETAKKEKVLRYRTEENSAYNMADDLKTESVRTNFSSEDLETHGIKTPKELKKERIAQLSDELKGILEETKYDTYKKFELCEVNKWDEELIRSAALTVIEKRDAQL